jgi:hypothetical protein
MHLSAIASERALVCQVHHLDPLTGTHSVGNPQLSAVSLPPEHSSLVVAVYPLSLEGFSLGFKACNDGIDHRQFSGVHQNQCDSDGLPHMDDARDATGSLVIQLI